MAAGGGFGGLIELGGPGGVISGTSVNIAGSIGGEGSAAGQPVPRRIFVTACREPRFGSVRSWFDRQGL